MAFEWLDFERNIYRVIQTFPSVAASTIGPKTAIPIASFGGTLTQLAISTVNSLQIDFSIWQHATAPEGSVDEIYRVDGLTQFWQREDHTLRFKNTDDPPTTNLYILVENRDEVTATGVITLQLYIKAPGTGGS